MTTRSCTPSSCTASTAACVTGSARGRPTSKPLGGSPASRRMMRMAASAVSVCATVIGKGNQPSLRAARRMAGAAAPPHQMRTGSRGTGRMMPSKRKNGPSCFTHSPVRSWRRIASVSSRRRPRSSKSTPAASYSSFSQPADTPQMMRSCVSTAAVATLLATVSGSRSAAR